MACTLAVLPQRSSARPQATDQGPVYRPRNAAASPLWRLIAQHADPFLGVYEERYAARYGVLRAVVARALEAFQRCGILAWGFARVRCPDCRHEYLLAFSCKQRCLCPSCHSKRQTAFGAFVSEQILAAVPHRHVVLSLPRRLRSFFRRRSRLSRLARLAYETIKELLQTAAGNRHAVPGAVACLQSAGDLLDWHPHVHLLIAWGLFRPDGSFVSLDATPDPETVARLFRHKVLRWLRREGVIDDRLVRNLLGWRHTGFGAHVSRAIPADAHTPEVVARYMARPPITPERLLTADQTDQVIYRANTIHPRHQANFRVFTPPDFLAELSAHIPDPHEKTTLYYGWYSNRSRSYRQRRGGFASASVAAPVSEVTDLAPLAVRQAWARLIRRVYEVDPLLCPRCGETMRVIVVIDQPAVVRQILDHLGIAGERSPPMRKPPVLSHRDWSGRAIVCERPAWTYDAREADAPLLDPLTV